MGALIQYIGQARPTIIHGKEGDVEYRARSDITWGQVNPRQHWNKYDLHLREASKGKHGGF